MVELDDEAEESHNMEVHLIFIFLYDLFSLFNFTNIFPFFYMTELMNRYNLWEGGLLIYKIIKMFLP